MRGVSSWGWDGIRGDLKFYILFSEGLDFLSVFLLSVFLVRV